MSASSESINSVCHMALIAELLNRSSERLQSLRDPQAAEYSRTLAEVEAIVARLKDLVSCLLD
ncbi:hypothetical protein [Granulicella paludicola]|uniref:hypothetical protein n=1 Tax=Granulicella paludicola TaxID=474951 RepID=UPI0021E04F6C|nr:hypothetical protein [Granulicella paludicola]